MDTADGTSSWTQTCLTKGLKLKLLIFVWFVTLIATIGLAVDTPVFTKPDSEAFHLVCFSLFIISQVAVSIRCIWPKYLPASWITMVLLLLALVCHQEINARMVTREGGTSAAAFRFYIDNSQLLAATSVTLLHMVLLSQAWTAASVVYPVYSGVRYIFMFESPSVRILDGLIFVVLSLTLFITIAGMVYQRYSRDNQISPSTGRKTSDIFGDVNISCQSMNRISLDMENKPFIEDLQIEKTKYDSKLQRSMSSPTIFEPECAVIIAPSKRQSMEVLKYPSLASAEIYESIIRSLEEDKDLDLYYGEDIINSDDDEKQAVPSKENYSPQQRRFEFHHYDKKTNRVVLHSNHLTINQLLHDLSIEYSKRKSKPFSNFLNRQIVTLKKSNTMADGSAIQRGD